MPRAVYDPSRLSVSGAGVTDLFYPLGLAEIRSVRDRVLAGLSALLLPRTTRGDRQAEIIALLIPQFINEILSVYQAQALLRRAAEAGRIPEVREQNRVLYAFSQNMLPEITLGAQVLTGFPVPPAWRKLARWIRDRRRPGPIRWTGRGAVGTGVTTVALGDMIEEHARRCGEVVRFVRLEEWFPPLPSETPAYAGDIGGLKQDVLAESAEAFRAGGEVLEGLSLQYLSQWLDAVYPAIDRRIAHLLLCPKTLPRSLWRGTGGNLWGRLLSHACRLTGGQVTGHDHALGIAMFRTTHDSVIEHIGVDRFVMWSDGQVALGEVNRQGGYAFFPQPVTLVPLVSGTGEEEEPSSVNASRQGRRLLYVGTLYTEGRVVYNPMIPPSVLIDWEARMIAELTQRGWDVTVKPHPESMVLPPDAYRTLGATILTGRFEDVVSGYDVCLFCEGYSTPFYRAIEGKIPFAMADVGVHVWHPEALDALTARCPYVACTTDSDNRLQTDWDAVSAALEQAPLAVGDMRFSRMFLR